MLPILMENQGHRRRTFSLLIPPPKVQRPRKGGQGDESPIFEPFEEMLPLQSGYYSYVIDDAGHFRVKWGNTRSHSAMAGRRSAAAAGRFRVNRMGRVIEVWCQSSDYKFYNDRYDVREYLIRAFGNHAAFDLNPVAIFHFYTDLYTKISLSADGQPLQDYEGRLAILENEGAGSEIIFSPTNLDVESFSSYKPPAPIRLYSMHLDQLALSVEEQAESFEFGPGQARLAPGHDPIRSGKNNFIIDNEGWTIIGMTGHQILSGGAPIGAAGHVHFDISGIINKIDLNFSGHYRPPLTADYARYCYRTISVHPLLRLANDCQFSGRKFDDCEVVSTVLRFTKEELETDDADLDLLIEASSF